MSRISTENTINPSVTKIIKMLEDLPPTERGLLKNIIREEDNEWEERFGNILKRIRSKTGDCSYKEIQSIVDKAVEEVRKGKGC